VARELESGTFRLAWTQNVSRVRWNVVRLLATGLAGMAVVGLLSLIVTWWAGPPDPAGSGGEGAGARSFIDGVRGVRVLPFILLPRFSRPHRTCPTRGSPKVSGGGSVLPGGEEPAR
jgi:hypothetical protein